MGKANDLTEKSKTRRTFYGCRSANTCAFCAFHGKSLTPKQIKKRGCLGKECTALIRHEHPFWEMRDKKKQLRAARKERLEQEYIILTNGGGANAVHTEAASGQGS